MARTQSQISFASRRTQSKKRRQIRNQHISIHLKVWRQPKRELQKRVYSLFTVFMGDAKEQSIFLWYSNTSRTLAPVSRGSESGMVFVWWQHQIILVTTGTMENVEIDSDKVIHHTFIEKKFAQFVCVGCWGHRQLVFWISNSTVDEVSQVHLLCKSNTPISQQQ